jgi:hypothetical protein
MVSDRTVEAYPPTNENVRPNILSRGCIGKPKIDHSSHRGRFKIGFIFLFCLFNQYLRNELIQNFLKNRILFSHVSSVDVIYDGITLIHMT